MTARLSAALAAACLGLLFGADASATPPLAGPSASATALAIEIIGSDQTVVAATAQADAPPTTEPTPAPFAYPDDGSIVTAEVASVSTAASNDDGTADYRDEAGILLLTTAPSSDPQFPLEVRCADGSAPVPFDPDAPACEPWAMPTCDPGTCD